METAGSLYMTDSCPKPHQVNLGCPDLLHPYPPNKRKEEEPTKRRQRKRQRELQPRAGSAPPSSLFATWPPSSASPSCSWGNPVTLADVLHPTLVSSRNSSTAPVALSFHSCLTAGALGCSRPQSLLTLFYSLLIWGAQALHSTNRWWRDCLLPLLHHQRSLDSSLCVPGIHSCRKDPIAACPDSSWQ